MKKIFCFLLISFLIVSYSSTVMAQLKIGVDVNANFPRQGFKNYFANGFGGDAYIKYLFLAKHLSLGAKVGYIKFPSNNGANSQFNYNHIALLPVKGNFEFYLLTNGIKPFAGIDFGIYNVKVSENLAGGGTAEYNQTYLGYAPLVGLAFGLLEHLDLNFTARFERIRAESHTNPSMNTLRNLTYVDFLIGLSFTF